MVPIDESNGRCTRRRTRCAYLGVACLAALLGATAAAAEAEGRWDLELGGGVLLFSPNVAKIPRGESETALDPLVELSLGRHVSDRLELRLSFAHASGAESDWKSEDDQGTAVIPTPSVTSAFVALETPLLPGGGRLVPHAGVGVGFVSFSEVDESIRFDWGTHVTNNRIRFGGHTDASILFDLGVRARLRAPLGLVTRYRLISAFDNEQVNTVDRVTLTLRVDW